MLNMQLRTTGQHSLIKIIVIACTALATMHMQQMITITMQRSRQHAMNSVWSERMLLPIRHKFVLGKASNSRGVAPTQYSTEQSATLP